MKYAFAAAATLASAIASPISLFTRNNDKTYNPYVTIHESCNATQYRMIAQGLNETWAVATYAQEYVRTHGANDSIFQLYFGNKPDAYSQVLGVWESVLTSDKTGVLFRCDNPDGNCGQPGWRGHWRGSNATSETVICDLSYTDRKYNAAFCMFGYQLAVTPPSNYWSVDLIHRLFHVPQVTNGAVQHYADDLSEVLELAVHNSTYSPFDSDALQYFAAHVYALKVGGTESCIGEISHDHDDHAAHATSSAPAAVAPTSAPAAPAAASAAPAAASSKAADCHTHADGTVHCV